MRKRGFEPLRPCERQSLKQANLGNYRRDSVDMAMRDLSELRLACLQAIGFEREYGDEPDVP